MIKLKKEQEQKIAEIKDLMAQKNSASILECTNDFLQNEEIKQEVIKTFDGKLANFYWVMAQMFPENASDFRAMAQADLYEHYWNEKITPEEWNELTPDKQHEWMEKKDARSQKRYAIAAIVVEVLVALVFFMAAQDNKEWGAVLSVVVGVVAAALIAVTVIYRKILTRILRPLLYGFMLGVFVSLIPVIAFSPKIALFNITDSTVCVWISFILSIALMSVLEFKGILRQPFIVRHKKWFLKTKAQIEGKIDEHGEKALYVVVVFVKVVLFIGKIIKGIFSCLGAAAEGMAEATENVNRSFGLPTEFNPKSKAKKSGTKKVIGTAYQDGDWIYVCDENGATLFKEGGSPHYRLVGYTSSSVTIDDTFWSDHIERHIYDAYDNELSRFNIFKR